MQSSSRHVLAGLPEADAKDTRNAAGHSDAVVSNGVSNRPRSPIAKANSGSNHDLRVGGSCPSQAIACGRQPGTPGRNVNAGPINDASRPTERSRLASCRTEETGSRGRASRDVLSLDASTSGRAALVRHLSFRFCRSGLPRKPHASPYAREPALRSGRISLLSHCPGRCDGSCGVRRVGRASVIATRSSTCERQGRPQGEDLWSGRCWRRSRSSSRSGWAERSARSC